jgi:hypothetical protein
MKVLQSIAAKRAYDPVAEVASMSSDDRNTIQ